MNVQEIQGFTFDSRKCGHCRKRFKLRGPQDQLLYCSSACAAKAKGDQPPERQWRSTAIAFCKCCGSPFKRTKDRRTYCSPVCSLADTKVYKTKAEQNTAVRHRRRARINCQPAEAFSATEIFERDDWRCQLCGLVVDRELSGMDLMGPTLDHITPIAKGGGHTRSNSQLAHRLCNIRKGASIKEDT